MTDKILIIDDDTTIGTVLKEELEEIGYIAFYADGADAGLEILFSKKIDLVLLDLKMPGKDGFYVLNKLNESNIKTKVIVLTAYADVKSAIESARLGASDFISKPYDLDELIITIRKVLQKEEDEN